MEKEIIQTGICRYDDLPAAICEQLSSAPEHFCISGDRIYLMIEQEVFCLRNDPAGNKLVYAILRKDRESFPSMRNAQDVYERLLKDPGFHPDPSLFRKYRIRQTGKRGIAVFQSFSVPDKDLCSMISAMVPAETGDSIIPINYRTAVFIKDLEGQTKEEMREFIEAVIGTIETEGYADICAGIGREYSDIEGIRTSYMEAESALKLGMRYHRQEHVFIYEEQTLERIVDSIPEDQKEEILKLFFGTDSEHGLSDEMLETVRVFFRNDLNLTAASKQLFIHRNTLNYRLDKIKKDYGLDLRSFQDAVIFRVISEIASKS